jgi:P4 family phage/plasmid primase-like protien
MMNANESIKQRGKDLAFVRENGTELPQGLPTTVIGLEKPLPYHESTYANLLAQQLPLIRTVGSTWYVYEGGRWKQVSREMYRPKALSIIPPEERTDRRAKALLDHLEGCNQVPVDSFIGFHKFDEEGNILINVANGIVKLDRQSGAVDLLPYSEEHGFTQQAAASYMPQNQPLLFERTLSEVLPDPEDRELLQLCCGNFLYPDCRFETALVCYGEAGRGKSTIADPIAAALGSGLIQRLSMSQICDPKSYHLPKLRFAAVNLGTELDAVAVDESANFKTLVSGEEVEARPIYGEPFTMRTSAKLWFLANGLPRFKNGTEAELRRTRFIRFDHCPEKRDVTLKSRLLLERDGVFNFMLEGLHKLMTLPQIPLGSTESRRVHERFKVSNDPLGTFVSRHCLLSPEGMVSKESLKEAFAAFCEDHGLPVEFETWFFKRLYERFTQLVECQTRTEGGRIRSIRGIMLKGKSGGLNDY